MAKFIYPTWGRGGGHIHILSNTTIHSRLILDIPCLEGFIIFKFCTPQMPFTNGDLYMPSMKLNQDKLLYLKVLAFDLCRPPPISMGVCTNYQARGLYIARMKFYHQRCTFRVITFTRVIRLSNAVSLQMGFNLHRIEKMFSFTTRRIHVAHMMFINCELFEVQ